MRNDFTTFLYLNVIYYLSSSINTLNSLPASHTLAIYSMSTLLCQKPLNLLEDEDISCPKLFSDLKADFLTHLVLDSG